MLEALTEIAEAAEDHSTVVDRRRTGWPGRVGACRFVGAAVRSVATARWAVELRVGEH